MENRNVSLEIKKIYEQLEMWKELRKKVAGRRNEKEKERYEYTGKVLRGLVNELAEAKQYQRKMRLP